MKRISTPGLTSLAPTPHRVPPGVRRAAIVEMINRSGFATVSQIATAFQVTEMTVRRDLHRLSRRGLLTRTHGGGISLGRHEVYDPAEPGFSVRRRKNSTAKAVIARAAASLIGERESVGLDVGTSALALAEAMAERGDVTVFTSNLYAAVALGLAGCPVHILGGPVRGPELSVLGSTPITQIREFYLSKYFLGVSGLTEDGFFDYSLEDTEVKRAFMAQAEAVIVLCDATKFNHRSVSKVCELRSVAMIVTDESPPAHLAAALSHAGVEVLVAEPIVTPSLG